MAKPCTQFSAGGNVLKPQVNTCLFFGYSPWPEPVNQNPESVSFYGRFINPFNCRCLIFIKLNRNIHRIYNRIEHRGVLLCHADKFLLLLVRNISVNFKIHPDILKAHLDIF